MQQFKIFKSRSLEIYVKGKLRTLCRAVMIGALFARNGATRGVRASKFSHKRT